MSGRPVLWNGQQIGVSVLTTIVGDPPPPQAVFEVTADAVVAKLGGLLSGAFATSLPGARAWAAIGEACGFEQAWWPAAENVGAFLRGYGRATDDAMASGRWTKFKRAHASLVALVATALDVKKLGAPAYRRLLVYDSKPPIVCAPDAAGHDEFEDVLRKNRTLTADDLVSRLFAAPPAEQSLERLGAALDELFES